MEKMVYSVLEKMATSTFFTRPKTPIPSIHLRKNIQNKIIKVGSLIALTEKYEIPV